MLVVVSTGFGVNDFLRDDCENSVDNQMVLAEHVYIDAKLQNPTKSGIENIRDVVMELDPADIVVSLDGDDRLATPHALQHVLDAYQDPDVWMTFGQFMYADGTLGWANHYPHCVVQNNAYRKCQWLATHLKTFRAGLFQKIPLEYLQFDKEWIPKATDLAWMFPMLEMAGGRHKYLDKILYVYSGVKNDDLALEQNCAQLIRAMQPLQPLEDRPW